MARVGSSSATTTWMRTISSTSIRGPDLPRTPRFQVETEHFRSQHWRTVVYSACVQRDKKKTFFFFNQEWRRIIEASAPTSNPTMPNADRPTRRPESALRGSCVCTEPGHLCPHSAGTRPAFAAKLAAAGLSNYRVSRSRTRLFRHRSSIRMRCCIYQSTILPKVNTGRGQGYNRGSHSNHGHRRGCSYRPCGQ